MSAEDIKNMTHQQFYEKYWTVNGKPAPPLSEFDKQVLAAYDLLKDGEQLFVFKSRGGRHRLARIAEDKFKRSLPDATTR